MHPKYPDQIYELNYGFVPGVIAPDGEALDAYVVGADRTLQRCCGTVITVVRRRDDVEDKLVVAVLGEWDTERVRAAVHFQERWFDSYVEMA